MVHDHAGHTYRRGCLDCGQAAYRVGNPLGNWQMPRTIKQIPRTVKLGCFAALTLDRLSAVGWALEVLGRQTNDTQGESAAEAMVIKTGTFLLFRTLINVLIKRSLCYFPSMQRWLQARFGSR